MYTIRGIPESAAQFLHFLIGDCILLICVAGNVYWHLANRNFAAAIFFVCFRRLYSFFYCSWGTGESDERENSEYCIATVLFCCVFFKFVLTANTCARAYKKWPQLVRMSSASHMVLPRFRYRYAAFLCLPSIVQREIIFGFVGIIFDLLGVLNL